MIATVRAMRIACASFSGRTLTDLSSGIWASSIRSGFSSFGEELPRLLEELNVELMA